MFLNNYVTLAERLFLENENILFGDEEFLLEGIISRIDEMSRDINMRRQFKNLNKVEIKKKLEKMKSDKLNRDLKLSNISDFEGYERDKIDDILKTRKIKSADSNGIYTTIYLTYKVEKFDDIDCIVTYSSYVPEPTEPSRNLQYLNFLFRSEEGLVHIRTMMLVNTSKYFK